LNLGSGSTLRFAIALLLAIGLLDPDQQYLNLFVSLM